MCLVVAVKVYDIDYFSKLKANVLLRKNEYFDYIRRTIIVAKST